MTVVVYGKADCSLCDKAIAVVDHLRREFRFDVEYRDITADPDLFARYRYRIPVVVLGGRELASCIVTIPTLRAALRQALPA